MEWIFIGVLAGSLVTSTHDTKEHCYGRAATMKEAGVIRGKCTDLPSNSVLGVTTLGNGMVIAR